MILTDEDARKLALSAARNSGVACPSTSALTRMTRLIEAAIIAKVRKQILEEICFKMADGSPNRQRIHALIDSWEMKGQ